MFQGMIIKIFPDTDIEAYRRYIRECGYSSSVHKDYLKVGKPLNNRGLDPAKLGKILLKLRTYKRLDRQTVAKKIGVSEDAIYVWETGRRVPKDSHLTIYCDILGVDKKELMDNASKES